MIYGSNKLCLCCESSLIMCCKVQSVCVLWSLILLCVVQSYCMLYSPVLVRLLLLFPVLAFVSLLRQKTPLRRVALPVGKSLSSCFYASDWVMKKKRYLAWKSCKYPFISAENILWSSSFCTFVMKYTFWRWLSFNFDPYLCLLTLQLFSAWWLLTTAAVGYFNLQFDVHYFIKAAWRHPNIRWVYVVIVLNFASWQHGGI